MRKLLFFASFAIAMFITSCSNGQNENPDTDLDPKEFAARFEQEGSPQLIDVRTPDEFNQGHIPDARNINWNGPSFEQGISGLDKSKPVYVYCRSGARSSAAADQMRSNGFEKVYELDGGILRWEDAGLPTE